MEKDRELEDCPFCGSSNLRLQIVKKYKPTHIPCDTYAVNCKSCRVHPIPSMSKEEAIKAWNTRTSKNPKPEVRAEDFKYIIESMIPAVEFYIEHEGGYLLGRDLKASIDMYKKIQFSPTVPGAGLTEEEIYKHLLEDKSNHMMELSLIAKSVSALLAEKGIK